MEVQPQHFVPGSFIETTTGNKVSRRSVLCGSSNTILTGKNIIDAGAILRGDLAAIRTGRYCIVSKKVVLRPPFKKFSKGVAFFPMLIGDHVFIGEGSVVNAASIGSFVYIGKNCVIGRRCVLKDCCYIEDNSIVAPETHVPCFGRYSGCPAAPAVGRPLPECTKELMVEFTKSYHKQFVAKPN